jgi:hypothetical protein
MKKWIGVILFVSINVSVYARQVVLSTNATVNGIVYAANSTLTVSDRTGKVLERSSRGIYGIERLCIRVGFDRDVLRERQTPERVARELRYGKRIDAHAG